MTDQSSNVTLKYSIDEQALTALLSRSDDLVTNLESISNANDEVSRSAQMAFAGMSDAIRISDAEIKALDETFATLNGKFSGAVDDVIPAVDELKTSETQVTDILQKQIDLQQQMKDNVDQLLAADTDRIAKAKEWADIIQANNQQAVGYGQSGGMIGPAEDTGDDSSGASGGLGNLSAVGRAFMTGGRQFKSQGLSGIGSGLYEAQGAIQVAKLAEGFGESIQVAIPALEGLSAGVVGLGAVALIAAPAVIIGVAALNSLNDTMKEVNQAAQDAAKTQKDYGNELLNGSYQKAQADLRTAQAQQVNDLVAQGHASQEVNSAQQQFNSNFGIFGGLLFTIADKTGVYGSVLQDADKAVTDNTQAERDHADAIAASTKALAFFTNVKAIETAGQQEEERFKLIQQGSAETVTQQMEANAATQKANQDVIDGLEAKYNKTSDPQQQSALDIEIQNYIQKNKDLSDEYKFLDTQVLGYVSAIEQQRKATDGAIAGIEAENQWEIKKSDLIKNSTDQQIRDMESANRRQMVANAGSIAELEQLLARTTDDTEIAKIQAKIADYNKQNDDLAKQYTDLVKVIEPLVAANDALKASFKDVGSLFTDAGDAALKAGATREKYNDDSAKLDASWKDAQSKADDAFKLKRAQEITTFNDKQAQDDKKNNEKWIDETDKVYADYNAAQTKQDATILKYQTDKADKEATIQTDLSDKIATIQSDLADKIGDIQDKARNDELDAASNLDARKIAQIQRKEDQDITNAQDAAKKQEDTATKAADKQKAQLEKDTEKKIEDLKAQGEAERAQRLADGLAKIQEEKDNAATDRQNRIDDFNNKLTDEDQQRRRETDARYADYITKKGQLDSQFKDSMKQLSDQFTVQSNSVDTHYKNLSSIQTTGQTTIETSWKTMLDNLNSQISVSTTGAVTSISSTTPSYDQTTQTTGFANANLLNLDNMAGGPGNNFGDFAGYTGDAGTADNYGQTLGQDNRNNNYGDLAGYRPYASGGLTEANQTFIAGDGGGPELIRMRQPGQVFNAQDTAAMLGGGGRGVSIGTLIGKMEINGANMSPDQIGDIAAARIIEELKKAIGD